MLSRERLLSLHVQHIEQTIYITNIKGKLVFLQIELIVESCQINKYYYIFIEKIKQKKNKKNKTPGMENTTTNNKQTK